MQRTLKPVKDPGATGNPAEKFSACLVWTPIPLITWLLPFVGHMGICSSRGTILDFAGPYTVSTGNFAFGDPTRYLRLDASKAAVASSGDLDEVAQQQLTPELRWDTALQASAIAFQQRNYNLMGENCHAFCAYFLNDIAYGGSRTWNMIHLVGMHQFALSGCTGVAAQAAMMFLWGRYVSFLGAAKQWLPFCVIMPVGLYFGTWCFALAWAGGLCLPIIAWFLFYNYVLAKN